MQSRVLTTATAPMPTQAQYILPPAAAWSEARAAEGAASGSSSGSAPAAGGAALLGLLLPSDASRG